MGALQVFLHFSLCSPSGVLALRAGGCVLGGFIAFNLPRSRIARGSDAKYKDFCLSLMGVESAARDGKGRGSNPDSLCEFPLRSRDGTPVKL